MVMQKIACFFGRHPVDKLVIVGTARCGLYVGGNHVPAVVQVQKCKVCERKRAIYDAGLEGGPQSANVDFVEKMPQYREVEYE